MEEAPSVAPICTAAKPLRLRRELQSRGARAYVSATAAGLLLCTSFAFSQSARLYAPRPPAGSTFVRVVNPTDRSVEVRIGGGPPQKISASSEVGTIFRIAPGNKPLKISIDGRTPTGDLIPPANKFVTLILKPAQEHFGLTSLFEETTQIDALRADLRFYNLIDGCKGALRVVDGPQIFDGVATEESRRRSINPVEATLIAECGDVLSSRWKLPALKPGDHYSIFLLGDRNGPTLKGQQDETEPYRENTQ